VEAAVEIPDPRYLETQDGAFIAYQVVGDGPVDIAWQFDFGWNLDVWWEWAWIRDWLSGLASFGRLILHDARGFGLSSRNVAVPNLEIRADDLRSVLDEVDSTSAVIGGWFEGLAPGILLAASRPSRVRALVWWNPSPRTVWAPDYPWGEGPEDVARALEALKHWGTGGSAESWADEMGQFSGHPPSQETIRFWAKKERNTCTPDVAEALQRIWWQSDIRGVLPSIQAPALLLVTEGEDELVEVANHVASLMPNARTEEFAERGWLGGDVDIDLVNRPRLDAVARFIGLQPKPVVPDTILSTILFTDIVSSTTHQARLGDRDWKQLIETHNHVIRQALTTWRGVENDTAGDSFYATFDGPARAIHCANDVQKRVRDLGIELRAGVHTGECELVDGKCAGISVSTGARIAALAGASQVLVSQTVKDLVAGSGFTFTDAGEHELKGIPERYRLYTVH
jgi:class 3 adenylate cyclase/pimeloyl-ACP methyl ester carboxylesterase